VQATVFTIQIFGVPPSSPGDYEWIDAAIDRAKRELQGKQYPATAQVTDEETKKIVWAASKGSNGEIVEHRK
jgi:hypothetical protein